MAGAVAGVIISSLPQKVKSVQSANIDNDSIVPIATTISTPVANNSAPNTFVISHADLRRLVHM
jgi:hypothetical protein